MERLVKLASIFSDINRLKILGLIVRDTELCVCEICDTLELSQPLVSRHLRKMREAEILTSEQKGKWVVYSLTTLHDEILECWIKEINKNFVSLPILVACDIK